MEANMRLVKIEHMFAMVLLQCATLGRELILRMRII